MFVLSKELQILKRNLKLWNKNMFGNEQDQIRKVEQIHSKMQHEMDNFGHSDELAD